MATPRVIAVDWSGARTGAARKIWLADVAQGRLRRLESGRGREALTRLLIDQAKQDPDLVVGLDFAFSFPIWYLQERGLDSVQALWELAADEGERWLTDCEQPFWGRPGRGRPDHEGLRRTDLDVKRRYSSQPKSPFQVGGAGHVGDPRGGVRVVKEARARYDARLGRVERSDGWPRLVRTVEDTVRKMPLWKLQTIGDERVEFLYEQRERENAREITLKPGVAYCFRQFYSMIIEMVQGAWTNYIRRTNVHLLGPDAELRYFLFGSDRQDLSAYRDLLDDVQKGRCFYCERRMAAGSVAVDRGTGASCTSCAAASPTRASPTTGARRSASRAGPTTRWPGRAGRCGCGGRSWRR